MSGKLSATSEDEVEDNLLLDNLEEEDEVLVEESDSELLSVPEPEE